MGLAEFFSWTSGQTGTQELPEVFPLPVPQGDYINTDVTTIYSKILTDTLERTHGLEEDQVPLLWDSCMKSSKSEGLLTMLAKAMTDKAELYLVYDKAVNVIRLATQEEKNKIQQDYMTKAESSSGVYITFKAYKRSDMVKLYSALAYCTVSALNRTLNISAAVQLKFSKLRESVSLTDSGIAEAQAQSIATALLNQRPIMMDAADSVETASPDLSATEKSIAFISSKLAFYLGMPSSYITGDQTTGIGSTGEADMRAVERGLKAYYYSILKPSLEAIFGVTVEYKSQDVRNIQSGIEVLKVFSMTDEELLSRENKTMILNKILDLPEDAEGDGPAPQPEVVQVPPRA